MRRIWDHDREEDYNEARGVLIELFADYEFNPHDRLTFLCSALNELFYDLMNSHLSDKDISIVFDDCVKALYEKVQDDLETRFEFEKVVRQYGQG